MFVHIWFIPLIPLQSVLVMDDGTGNNRARIPLSLRSVLVAWFRGACCLTGVILLLYGVFWDNRIPLSSDWGRLRQLLGGFGLLVVCILSYPILRAGRKRAVRLAEAAKIRPDFVNNHFDRLKAPPLSEKEAVDMVLNSLGLRNRNTNPEDIHE